ncbi:uncharacterized protein LOC128394036, partial [Panonychus citri]|uniref:uncharacterized protein LOC128394036 n=1 Tax=Panonychus citri TaxID=50023 RepID=UPI00230772D9
IENFLISKRIHLMTITTILLILYDVKLLKRIANLEPTKIIYSSSLCFLPTWRDDLNTSESNCFGNCCATSKFDLNSDFNCIVSCRPSLISFFKQSNVFFTFLPVKIIPEARKKVISISLYGYADLYLRNSIKVIHNYKKLLPDWICRFYVGSDVSPLLINRLIHEGAEVIIVYQNQPNGDKDKSKIPSFHGMFWRFFVSEDENVDRYLVRDSDSLPIQREIDSINSWISEAKMFHVMRDHFEHATEILGGLWGGIVNLNQFNLSSLYEISLIDGYDQLDGIWIDQYFLRYYVWPIVRENMTCHVSYRWWGVDSTGCKDFPTQRIGNQFVGASQS